MTRKLGIAALQLMKNFENNKQNLKKFENEARSTKKMYPWVDLIFTGELYLQNFGTDDWKEHAEPIPNDLTNRLSKLAQELDCWLVPGSFLEKEDENIYNTALVLNPNGEIVALYRKIFPWMPHEDTNWGADFVVFDISDIARVGIVICYDIWFPELFRTLAWMGAEVILQPSLTCASDRPPELVLAQAQAIINQCYIINVNGICPSVGGKSIFVDPEGRIL
jgi:formamidase